MTGASIETTLELWASSLRDVKGRVVRGFAGLDVGDRVTVTLDHTDVERGFIDFSR